MTESPEVVLTERQQRLLSNHVGRLYEATVRAYRKLKNINRCADFDDVASEAQSSLMRVVLNFPLDVEEEKFIVYWVNSTRWAMQKEWQRAGVYRTISYDAMEFKPEEGRTYENPDPFHHQKDDRFLVVTTPDGDTWRLTHDVKLVEKNVLIIPKRIWEYFYQLYMKGGDIKDLAQQYGTSPKTIENQLADWSARIRHNVRNEFVSA